MVSIIVTMLTDTEAQRLLSMNKRLDNDKRYDLPCRGKARIDLCAKEGSEKFILELIRSSDKEPNKGSLSHLDEEKNMLCRLCLTRHNHYNPGSSKRIPAPHIHIYKEGYDDKFAYPLDGDNFPLLKTNDYRDALDKFIEYCNITQKPRVELTVRLFDA